MTVEDRAHQAARDIDRAVEAVERSLGAGERSTGERFDRFRARKDQNRRIGAIAVVIAVSLATGLVATSMVRNSDSGSPAATGAPVPTRIGTLTITYAGCTLDRAADARAGPFTLGVVNETGIPRSVVVFKIASEARFAQMLAFVARVKPRFGGPYTLAGHASEDDRLVQSRFFEYASTSETDVEEHGSSVISGAFDPGTYGIECVGRAPERGSPSDFIGPIKVRSDVGG